MTSMVMNGIARAVGFADPNALGEAVFAAWKRKGAQIPDELIQFRAYVGSL